MFRNLMFATLICVGLVTLGSSKAFAEPYRPMPNMIGPSWTWPVRPPVVYPVPQPWVRPVNPWYPDVRPMPMPIYNPVPIYNPWLVTGRPGTSVVLPLR